MQLQELGPHSRRWGVTVQGPQAVCSTDLSAATIPAVTSKDVHLGPDPCGLTPIIHPRALALVSEPGRSPRESDLQDPTSASAPRPRLCPDLQRPTPASPRASGSALTSAIRHPPPSLPLTWPQGRPRGPAGIPADTPVPRRPRDPQRGPRKGTRTVSGRPCAK